MLRNNAGTIVSDPTQILGMETMFYRDLYKKSNVVTRRSMEEFVQEHINNMPSLDAIESNDLANIININEIQIIKFWPYFWNKYLDCI